MPEIIPSEPDLQLGFWQKQKLRRLTSGDSDSMPRSIFVLVMPLLFALAGCKPDKVAQEQVSNRPNPCDTPIVEPQRVSIISLVANPERYEGKAIVVTGFYKAAFEHSAIYLHEDDGRYSIKPNGFWLDGRIPDHMQNHYVTVQGVFTTTTRGHLAGWPGTLCGASALG